MEKKRRERINRCLDELKNIVLRAVNEEVTVNLYLPVNSILLH